MIVNFTGILLIVFIVWWFWIYKNRSEAVAGETADDIVVDAGIYSPAVIHAEVGKPITLRFLRKDGNPCSEKVIFGDLNLSADLPLNTPYEVRLTPELTGEFTFTCQMAMYRGKLVVK